MKSQLRILLSVLFWPVGIPYLLHRAGRGKAAAGFVLAFCSLTILGLSAVPWRTDAPPPIVRTSEQSETRPSGVDYKILKDERTPNEKRRVEVRLPEKVTAAVLQRIAYEIRALDSARYARTFIGYYLPNMPTDRSAWATTHFTPDLEVAIRGTTLEQDQQVSGKPDWH